MSRWIIPGDSRQGERLGGGFPSGLDLTPVPMLPMHLPRRGAPSHCPSVCSGALLGGQDVMPTPSLGPAEDMWLGEGEGERIKNLDRKSFSQCS